MAKRKGKKAVKGLVIALAVIAVIAGLVAVLNVAAVDNLIKKGASFSPVDYDEPVVLVTEENGEKYFISDRDFKVMHLTDIHIGGGFMSKAVDEKALNAVATMITAEKPDLVIATGDIAFPVPYMAGTFNNHSGAKAFANLMENLGVYWTVTFGNHDAEPYSYFSRENMGEFYENKEYTHCLFLSGPEDVDGIGNHVIEIKNSDGIITQGLVMIDSQAYVKNDIITSIRGDYDNIHDNQVEWYEKEIKRMNAENAEAIKAIQGDENGGLWESFGTVKTLAFFHIPLPEMADAWISFEEGGFADTEDFSFIDGILGEGGRRIYCGLGEDNMFEKMLEMNSTKAMFNGHDHYNSTTFEYKGIQFSYGYSIDYFAYSGIDKEGSQRGCTMITCKPDSSFTIEKFNYYSDRYALEGFTREDVTMQFEGVTYQVPAE
ncbi:MAG: metallophosphoesterase [Clostridia bacterium]|nr:metallophosphoesterase [Clostridia bacterium]